MSRVMVWLENLKEDDILAGEEGEDRGGEGKLGTREPG